jgi:hypothetical protein
MSVFYGVRLTDEISARIEATGKGKTDVITAALVAYFGESPKATEPEKMIIKTPRAKATETPKVAREIPKPETKPAKLGKCPRCEGTTIPWGPMRRCANCNQNWPI